MKKTTKAKDIEISQVCSADIDKICEIAIAAWEDIHTGYRKIIGDDDLYGRVAMNWQQRKAESIREKAEKMPAEVLVAKCNQEVVGFITFAINQTVATGEIGNNGVMSAYQGAGIGKKLYNRVLEIFRKHGLIYALVSTGYEDPGHARARAGYEKVGFKKMSTSITYSMKL
ncbi:MAG: GNAT family N-acetyltransferase [Victivallaceae bacterium]|nr:GNAT family N-acetyltransferase [Victivallaceae bacterium]